MFTDEIINNYITTFCLEARPYEYNFKSKFHLKKVYDFLIIIVVYYRKFFFFILDLSNFRMTMTNGIK